MLALLAPGQGAQTPGFLTPWFEYFQAVGMGELSKAMTENWSQISGLDLTRLGTTAEADEIKDTAVAQPLLLLGALTGAGALFAGDDSAISVVAGHSVGEIAAATFAQVIDADNAFNIVSTRGREMAKAASAKSAGMSAVLGGERAEVLNAISTAGLVAANDNGGGQIVAAGDLVALAALQENAPTGARVRPLAVAGAFHTSYMQPAVAPMRELAKGISVSNPKFKIISNKDGQVVNEGREVLDRIVNQIANPVRWDLCMQTLADLGVSGVIELPPAGTLVGLIKRAQPQIETFALKTPEDLAGAKEFVAKHGGN